VSFPFIRHNLSVGDALARSGVKGGHVPDYANSIQPVIVVANFSNTYSGEPLEGRGLSGRNESVPNGERFVYMLVCKAVGGLVVERMIIQGLGASGGWIDILDGPVATITQGPAFVLQIGGAVAVSDSLSGTTFELPTGVGPVDLSFLGVLDENRVYVPPGKTLHVFSDVVGPFNAEFEIAWREIPAAIGLP